MHMSSNLLCPKSLNKPYSWLSYYELEEDKQARRSKPKGVGSPQKYYFSKNCVLVPQKDKEGETLLPEEAKDMTPTPKPQHCVYSDLVLALFGRGQVGWEASGPFSSSGF